jgi:hypothetical protein
MFNNQHYQALAQVIADADRDDDGELNGPGLAEAIVNMLAMDDPAFDRQEFEQMAELTEGKE